MAALLVLLVLALIGAYGPALGQPPQLLDALSCTPSDPVCVKGPRICPCFVAGLVWFRVGASSWGPGFDIDCLVWVV